MSIQREIDRIKNNISDTYAALESLGAPMPAALNSENLAQTAAAITAVLYSAQSLTDAQKTQARANIGAASTAQVETAQNTANGKAPANHASTGTEYGTATDGKYGHVRVLDAPDATKNNESGHAVSPYALYQVSQAAQNAQNAADLAQSTASLASSKIDAAQTTANNALTAVNNRAPINHKSPMMNYGTGDGGNYGHVKLSNATDSDSNADGGIAATPKAVKAAKAAADAAQTTANSALSAANGRAPVDHASALADYGLGTDGKFGHVRLLDSPDAAKKNESGYAVTPYALDQVRQSADSALSTANGAAKKNHASTEKEYGVATDGKYGHVRLSDSVDSTSGNEGGYAATPYAINQVKQLAQAAQGAASAAEGAANTASSTASSALSAAQTAQATANAKAPMYTYGTADLTANASPLATGTLYFKYV